MNESNEAKLEVGMNVLEMTKSPGWRWLEAKIREELRIAYTEMRTMDVEGKSDGVIAAAYLQVRANINAYESVLAMIETALTEKEEAARALRDS